METSLFLDKPLEFSGKTKVAGMLTKLSDNTDLWQQEISQEAYKRLPYLSNYEVNVILDRLDEERGFAFGSIEVRPKSDLSSAERKVRPLSKASIPIVVKDLMLYPFDIFVAGREYRHLTEAKLNEALFRPDVFDAVRKRPPEQSMATDLSPPAMSGRYGALGSVKFAMPLLPLLDGQVLQSHKDRFLSEINEPSVKVAYANAHDGIKAAALSAARLFTTDVKKTASAAWSHVHPNVVQIKPLVDGNYLVKWANAEMFSPEEEVVGPEVAEALVDGTGAAQDLANGDTVTASPEATSGQALMAEGIKPVDVFGLWTVQDKNGTSLTGWAFPNVVSFDLQPVGMTLFTNGSVYSLQDGVVGKMVGKSTDMPKGEPEGYGFLYCAQGGKAHAILPVTVNNKFTGPDGRVKHVGSKDSGEPVTFSFSDDVKAPAKVGENEYLIPSTYSWMPLTDRVELINDPSMFVKTAHKNWAGLVEIRGDRDEFSISGAPLAKVARAHKDFVDRDQAAFMCVALGMRPDMVKSALDRAALHKVVSFEAVRSLGDPREKLAAAREKIKHAFANLDHPIRNYCLVKEASVLDDAMTADKILGLGFLNAENISTFVDMLPGLEQASSNVAEMLLASRLGMSDVPEAALERMLVSLEDVILGLKTLQQKEMMV